jgi:hypothetical protein
MGLAGFEYVDFPTYLEMMDQDRIIFGVGSVEVNEKLLGNSASVLFKLSPDFPKKRLLCHVQSLHWGGWSEYSYGLLLL